MPAKRHVLIALGIDVGSTTAKVVVTDPRGRLLWARCARHAGRAADVVAAMRDDAREATGAALEAYTGTLGTALAPEGASVVHEVQAVALSVRARVPGARTVVELGGQDAKVLWLDGERTVTAMNDRCAAGTGATLDRIAHRLGLTPDEVRLARPDAALRVTARCGVFAENDAVNLVQRGVPRAEVLGAVAKGVVGQCLASLTRGRAVEAPVVLLGGPHAHVPALEHAWRDALAAAWRRDVREGELLVPPAGQLFAAIGAALHALGGDATLAVARGVTSGERRLPPLVETDDDAREVRALVERQRSAVFGAPVGSRALYVGLDAGTTTCKAVAIDARGEVCASSYVPSSGEPVADARAALVALGAAARDARTLGVTGYGAPLVAAALDAPVTVVETDAHARGARSLWPEADVVVDVGGTDVKVLRLGTDGVASFHVSSQCAAGHGAFVAATAAELGVPVERIAERALAATEAPRFAIGCAIFMDTDRVTFQRDGHGPDAILAGLAWAVARSVWEHVVGVPPARLGRRFLLTGGAHRNAAIAWAQTRHLRDRVRGAEVRVAPRPELVGALGAALAARDAGARRSWGPVHAEVVRAPAPACDGCDLGCARTRVDVVRERDVSSLVLGGACERGASLETGRRTRRHAADLFDDECRRMFRPVIPAPDVPPPPRLPVIAIPRVLGLYRCAPLLLSYLRALGVPDTHVRVGPPTSAALFDAARVRATNDPCFPAKSVVAHVDAMLRSHADAPFDVLLLPAITHAGVDVRGTADLASCPLVASCGHTSVAALRRDGGDPIAALGVTLLTPMLTLHDPSRVDAQLFACFGPLLGIDAARHAEALAHARQASRTLHAESRARGQRLVERASREGRAAAVVLSRPYLVDPGFSHGVSMELAARGVPVLGLSSLPDACDVYGDLSGVLPALTNSGSGEKIAAARAVVATPSLVAVDLSSFRCGQDASIFGPLGDLLDAADKPWLAVHDLDEQRPAASLRMRIETFVAALRRYEARALARRVA